MINLRLTLGSPREHTRTSRLTPSQSFPALSFLLFSRLHASGSHSHIHLTQDEYFQVLKGSLGYILNGEKGVLTPDVKAGLIPAGGRHTFWLDLENSKGEELVFHCWVSPYQVEHGWDELFFRNFQAYLADCSRHGMRPSRFQT